MKPEFKMVSGWERWCPRDRHGGPDGAPGRGMICPGREGDMDLAWDLLAWLGELTRDMTPGEQLGFAGLLIVLVVGGLFLTDRIATIKAEAETARNVAGVWEKLADPDKIAAYQDLIEEAEAKLQEAEAALAATKAEAAKERKKVDADAKALRAALGIAKIVTSQPKHHVLHAEGGRYTVTGGDAALVHEKTAPVQEKTRATPTAYELAEALKGIRVEVVVPPQPKGQFWLGVLAGVLVLVIGSVLRDYVLELLRTPPTP